MVPGECCVRGLQVGFYYDVEQALADQHAFSPLQLLVTQLTQFPLPFGGRNTIYLLH